jgi:hypothetical protein
MQTGSTNAAVAGAIGDRFFSLSCQLFSEITGQYAKTPGLENDSSDSAQLLHV